MMSVSWELVAVGVDAALLAIVYTAYRRWAKYAEYIEEAPEYEVGEKLTRAVEERPDRTLPYVCVMGTVAPLGSALRSHYRYREKGVIQRLVFIEHRSKRVHGYWTDDTEQIVRKTVEAVPFVLTGRFAADHSVLVCKPFEAEGPLNALTVTYNKLEPSNMSVMEDGINRLYREMIKRYHRLFGEEAKEYHQEEMLRVGVQLVGLGKVVIDGPSGRIKLKAPSVDHKYIVSRLDSKEEVLEVMRSNKHIFLIRLLVFGAVGASILFYWVYKMYRRAEWERERARERRQRFIERQAANRRIEEGENGDNEERGENGNNDSNQNCVICFSAQREVVLLNCGHICVCGDCAHLLPHPQQCPLCRQAVVRIHPVYVS